MALILTQGAYADVDPRDTSAVCYLASAVDTDGNQYRVVWYPYDDFDGDDEGDACDWENPDRVDLRPASARLKGLTRDRRSV